MCFGMSVNKIGLWLGNLCVCVEEGAGSVGPRGGGHAWAFPLCALLLLPPRLVWGSPLSAELPSPYTLPLPAPTPPSPAQPRP